MSFSAKINIVVDNTGAATCSLPTDMVKTLREVYGFGHALCLEITWQHGGYLYSLWSGSISSDNMVEFPSKLVLMAANSENSKTTNMIRSGDLVTIRPLVSIGNAVQVFVKPQSAYDWEIILANASSVEESLLRTLSVVFVGQNLRIEITPTLVAKFLVTRIETGNSSSQKATAPVARMSNRSSLVVEPFAASKDDAVRTVFPSTTQPLATGKERPNKLPIDSVLRLIAPYTAVQSLRTLPQCFRYCNTDFLLRQRDPAQEAMDDSRDCLDMFLSSDSTNAPVTEVVVDDENTVLVHPLYLKSALDILLRVRSGLSIAPVDFSSSSLAENTIIGQLFKDKANPASSSLLVKIRVSENVRPYHISVPANARKVLSVPDFQRLFLKIVDDTAKAAISPTKITLSLVSKAMKSSGNNKNYFRKRVPRYSTSTLDAVQVQLIEATKAAFVRLLDTETPPSGFFLLSTGQVLSLSLPCELFDSSMTTSSSTISQAVQTQAFDFVVQIDGKEAPIKPRDVRRSTPEGCSLLSPPIPNYTVVTSYCKGKAARCMGITLPDCTDLLRIVADTNDSAVLPETPTLQYAPDCDNTWDNHLEVSSGETIGLEETISKAIVTISSQLLPLAVRESLYCGVSPTIGMVVTGGRGSGKSNVLSALATFFANNPRCVAHSEIVRCGDISDNAAVDILKALTEVFQRAAKNAPSLILLDDLDKICPSVHENEAHTHAGSSDGKFGLISLQLKRLLHSSLERVTESFEAAKRVCNQSSSHRNCLFSYNDCSKYCDAEIVSYHMEAIIALAQCRKVFVVASAEAVASIASELTSYPDCLLGDEVRIQPFTGSDRVILLQSALAKLGNPLDDDVVLNSSTALRDELHSILEGFAIADVKNFAKRISAIVYSQLTVHSIYSTSNMGTTNLLHDASHQMLTGPNSPSSSSSHIQQRFCTRMVDIIEAAKQFAPISSANGHSSSGGSFDGANSNSTTWKDIGGFEAVKSDVLGVLRLPTIFRRLYQRVPVRLPRAILLYGPPGCGKTAIAQAAGNDFGKNGFVCVRGPQLLDKYIGESEKAVRELFSAARRSGRPTLLFFDEFESLAAKRGKDNTGVTDRVVNQLLTFIDGVEDTMGSATTNGEDDDNAAQRSEPGSDGTVFLIVASSRPDLIDPALLRPGRIEKHVFIGMPDVADRIAILSNALRPGQGREIRLDEQVTAAIEFVARCEKASYMTPADLRAVISTANLIAAHEYIASMSGTQTRRHAISHSHILNAFSQTKPSLSAEDLRFYNSIYSQFKPDRSLSASHHSHSITTEDSVVPQQRMSLK